MFWFNEELLRTLCTYPKHFSATQKNNIKVRMSNYIEDFEKKFSFSKLDYLIIRNYVFEYIDTIIKTSRNKERCMKIINNNILDRHNLMWENNKIYNISGSTALVNVEIVDSLMAVRKTIRSDQPKEYISNERIILEYLSKFENLNDSYINLIDFDNSSLLLEAADNTLENYIKSNKLSFDEKKALLTKMCHSVRKIHSVDILHRDLQPKNVFIIYRESDYLVKIGDFGFSTIANNVEKEKRLRPSYGVPDYTAPEQREDLANCTKQSDIYSIGKLINFVMTKSPKNMNHELSNVAHICTRINPNERYDSVDKVVSELILI